MANYTNQQVLDKLIEVRDKFLDDGKLMQKNITTPDGSSIFYRSIEELEEFIAIYQEKVQKDNGSSGYYTWVGFYA